MMFKLHNVTDAGYNTWMHGTIQERLAILKALCYKFIVVHWCQKLPK